ncbi:MAG: hypothetical protein AB1772_05475, partial [Candidatus Zixiibacteriota bacterium]
MTKKSRKRAECPDSAANERVRLLYDHIRLTFIANASQIAAGQKPETLLKMIQTCQEIQPVDRKNEELWKTVQKVRQEVLGKKPAEAAPAGPPKKPRADERWG